MTWVRNPTDRRPESAAPRGFELDKGTDFAPWEQPELFTAEMRAAFKSLRQSI